VWPARRAHQKPGHLRRSYGGVPNGPFARSARHHSHCGIWEPVCVPDRWNRPLIFMCDFFSGQIHREQRPGLHYMQDFKWVHSVMAFLAATNFVISLLNTFLLLMG
jgi:hypothetical protein